MYSFILLENFSRNISASEKTDDFQRGIDGGSEEEEDAKVTKGASHAVCRVAGVVAESVGNARDDPNETGDGRINGTFQTS